jgi:Uncharacterized membrane protein (DUF2298)
MSLVFLGLAIAGLWINLLGAGLAARRFVGDYAAARAASVLAICLVCFCLEYFWGWGPRLPFLPLTAALSIWLIWRDRAVVRENWGMEALFAVGFFYCLLWRYTFPDIDFSEDKMPNFGLIESYMRGTRLPPPDLWMSPYRANSYYSFQHYGAALLGRLFGIGPGVSYHLAFCTLVGFMTLLMGSCIVKFCSWPVGRWVAMLSLLLGGCGIAVFVHLLVKEPYTLDIVRFLGGSIVHNDLTPLGHSVSAMMTTPGVEPRDLPMEPLSYFLTKGDFHPPLFGFFLLALAAALIAALETGAPGPRRAVLQALLAATVPITLVSNAWTLPLQCLLAGGWFVYAVIQHEKGCIAAGLAGAAVAAALEYPFLLQFSQQSISRNASIGMTAAIDHTPLLGWLLVFWPVLGILILAPFNRERRPLAVFFVVIWAVALVATEFLYNHDLYGASYIRFNSALKWWQWVYAGIIVTLGSLNLGSKSRACRYGTLILLVPTLSFAYDLGVQFSNAYKDSVAKKADSAIGHLSGAMWIERDPVIRDLIVVLSNRPDGITLESGLAMENTESPAVTLFSNKQSFLGWPWLEEVWRDPFLDVNQRFVQIGQFYDGTLPDRLAWLLHNDVKYILWLPRDNGNNNARFRPLSEQIKSRYFWHHMYGDDKEFAIGFWERIDGPPAHLQ